ncbi:MAG: ABC-F family ATP-binding cassette domain-containing protein [Pseudohongiellaceae bacterium]
MIFLNNISLTRGKKKLLSEANTLIPKAQRVGVIGRNGCGKTSLFRTISDGLTLDSGTIDKPSGLRISLMNQETPGVHRSAIDFVIDAHSEYRALEKKRLAAEKLQDGKALTMILDRLDAIGDYQIENVAQQILTGLGFSSEDYDKPIEQFSGGWRVKLNLAASLLCPSDLLMLDEPTNHLDLEATVWLEEWLLRYKGTLLLISHDRTFLDNVIDHVISFEHGQLKTYIGNYSAFEIQRAERLALESALYKKQQHRKKQIEAFIRRFRAKASKAKQAQSRMKELERMQEVASAHVDSPFQFEILKPSFSPNFLLQADELTIGYEKPLVSQIKLAVRAESRIGLLGFNGSGKSTLIKVLSGQLDKLSGTLTKSKNLRIGYYAQHQVDVLDPSATPVEIITNSASKSTASSLGTEQEIRDFLGGFHFQGSKADEAIGYFSGGEKTRLALAEVVSSKPNLLLLDEPTNHLDLEMCHALEMALQNYEGAMIIISHDRHLLANTVNEFYAIYSGNFSEFVGSIHDYEVWLKNKSEQSIKNRIQNHETGADRIQKKELRQIAAANRQKLAPLKRQLKLLESDIENISLELEFIEKELLSEEIYEPGRKTDLAGITEKQGRLKSLLQNKENEWYKIQQQLE